MMIIVIVICIIVIIIVIIIIIIIIIILSLLLLSLLSLLGINDSMIDDLMPVHDDHKAGGGQLCWQHIRPQKTVSGKHSKQQSAAPDMKRTPFQLLVGWLSKDVNSFFFRCSAWGVLKSITYLFVEILAVHHCIQWDPASLATRVYGEAKSKTCCKV